MDEDKTKIYGVGINDAGYVVQKKVYLGFINDAHKYKTVWMCPYYNTWKNILQRCYKHRENKNQTYRDASVCEEWLTFSNFKSWMEKQDWEGRYIDKDILFYGNKMYSPDTCVFVDRETNNFLLERGNARGKFLLGAYLEKSTGKFRANISFRGKRKFLGRFDSEESAHIAWAKEKLRFARILAEAQEDNRVSVALIERYSNYLTRAEECLKKKTRN